MQQITEMAEILIKRQGFRSLEHISARKHKNFLQNAQFAAIFAESEIAAFSLKLWYFVNFVKIMDFCTATDSRFSMGTAKTKFYCVQRHDQALLDHDRSKFRIARHVTDHCQKIIISPAHAPGSKIYYYYTVSYDTADDNQD